MDDIKTICGWCGATIKEASTDDFRISHGICPDCYAKQEAAIMAIKDAADHSIDMGGDG